MIPKFVKWVPQCLTNFDRDTGVSDFVHEDRLLHLGPAATRLSRPCASQADRSRLYPRTRRFRLAGSWMIAAGPGWEALCRPAALGGWGDMALVPPMWIAMTLAMMLPTAGPMILTYAEIADTAARQREPVVSPVVLTAGYVAVWLGFALAASVLQIVLARHAVLEAGRVGALVSGALFVVAGLYQFSALKHACLTLCRRPFPFFFANWTTETRGVFRLGLRQGMVCLGCCWAMMLLMFAVGAMNVIWMAALGMAMTVEKLATTARVHARPWRGVRRDRLGFPGIGVGVMASRWDPDIRVNEPWQIKGELTLSCNCTIFCPCVLSLGVHAPTEGYCQTWAARPDRPGPFRRGRSHRHQVRLHGRYSRPARPRQLDAGAVRRRQGVGAGLARADLDHERPRRRLHRRS